MTTAPDAPSPAPFTDGAFLMVPAGLVASVVTFLQMTAPPADLAARLADPRAAALSFERLTAADRPRYLDLFRRVGAPWLWNGRLRLAPDALAALLDDPGIEAAIVRRGETVVAITELDRRTPGETEIVYFGLVPEETGAGLGRCVMARLLEAAWAGDVARVWLHTCTFDHPGALAFYRRQGFAPYGTAVETLADPRLLGLLPRDAAPQIPLLEPGAA